MLRRLLSVKGLIALALPLAVSGMVWAGGEHCRDKAEAQRADAAKGSHGCLLSKNVKKTAKLTDDGAVITLVGKTDEAVENIKAHLQSHEKGTGCPYSPMSQEGVTAQVKLTDKGGEVTLTGNDAETIKYVQEWAKKPATCCQKDKSSA